MADERVSELNGLKPIPYTEARQWIRNADLLLWRPSTLLGRMIAGLGRSVHCHAAKAHWVPSICDWEIVETIEGTGGRTRPLRQCVEEAPGLIDWYATNPGNRFSEFCRNDSIDWSVDNVPGRPYGRRSFLAMTATYIPIVRVFWRRSHDDLAPLAGNPVCSSACAMADRVGGGVDPVPGLADAWVEPGDLERSHLYQYRGTLVLDAEGKL